MEGRQALILSLICYKVESCWFWKETKYYLYSLLHALITTFYFDHSQQSTNKLANLSEQSKMTHPQSRWCVPKMGLGFRMDTKGRDWSEVLGWEQPLCASGTPDSWDHSNKNTNQYAKRSYHIESCKHWFCFLQHHCLMLSNLHHHDIHLAQLRIASKSFSHKSGKLGSSNDSKDFSSTTASCQPEQLNRL